MATTYIGTVISKTGLSLRSGPGTEYAIVADSILEYGDQFYIYNMQMNGSSRWGSTGQGWVCINKGSTYYVQLEEDTSGDIMLMAVDSNDSLTTTSNTNITYSDDENLYTSDSTLYGTTNTITTSDVTYGGNENVANATMRLFGLPYQFTQPTDPRYSGISSVIGRDFSEKFLTDGVIAYFIPGTASFLPGVKNKTTKRSTANALLDAGSDKLSSLQELLGKDETADGLRFFDFQEDYNTYMKYVNVMCRTLAGFLDIEDTMDVYDEDGGVYKSYSMQKMDWRNYRWTSKGYTHAVSSALSKAKTSLQDALNSVFRIGSGSTTSQSSSSSGKTVSLTDSSDTTLTLNQLGGSQNFVPFYIDPSIDGNESYSNSTTETSVASKLKSIHSTMNEYGFLLNSASEGSALESVMEMGSSAWDSIMDTLDNATALGNVTSKILDGGASVLRGENIIIPEIYDSSDTSKSYNITIHLRTPYGDKLSVYVDILVPLIHLVCLAVPKQSTSNTYGSPFLIKMYVPGITNCDLGIVKNISITKNPDGDQWSTDGLPTAVDVTLSIDDLYSQLTISPSNEPQLFINNSSLIEYLATLGGLNLITPQLQTKIDMWVNTVVNSITDIPGNASLVVLDTIEHAFSGFFSLY